MFGYIQPDREELRFREFAEYRAYYCGLCRCIGKHFGEPMRLTLSYDCAFMALMLCAMAGREAAYKCRCLYKPLERNRMAAEEDENLRFAAEMNILLCHAKLQDDWRDERKFHALLGQGALSAAAGDARKRNPELFRAIQEGMERLSDLEREGCKDLDAPADAFAVMMREIACCAPVQGAGNRIAFPKMIWNLGRWVYLIDAWDDREKDKKSGSYNPFIASHANRERAEFILNYSLNEAINAYQLLDIKAHESLLDNIMLEGCPARNKQVLGGEDE